MAFPAFAAWAATYGKVYNGEEAATREAIYNANVAWIKAHQHEADGFTIGVNQFADLTQEEFAAQYLTLKPEDKRSEANMGTHEYSGADLPDDIDWSTKAAVSPVKNQGSCGSCWAFSTVGSLEGRAAIATGNLQQFSEQQFVDCDKDFGDQGCNGGLMDNAFKYLMQSKGACTEDSYGYKGSAGTCQIDSCTIGLDASKVTGYKDVAADADALKEAVAEGPVSVAIQANSPFFQLYTGGVFKSNFCGANLDHGVLAVGYGVDGGNQYWKVKNSWGASWGEQGYIRMIRGTKGATGECGILTGPPSYPVISSAVQAAPRKTYAKGFVRQPTNAIKTVATITDEMRAAAPTALDWSTQGATTPVKDQGQCGSCWAYSATEGIESGLYQATGQLMELSEQQIISCDKTDGGCNGGDLPTAFDYVQQAGGIDTQSDYPDTSNKKGRTGKCTKGTPKVVKVTGYEYAVPPCEGGSCSNQKESDMMAALNQFGPLSVCVNAAWDYYDSGILSSKCSGSYNSLDHCVQLVGYDTTGSQSYWKVRNSWASDWGENGFIRLPMGENACGIADEAMYVKAELVSEDVAV